MITPGGVENPPRAQGQPWITVKRALARSFAFSAIVLVVNFTGVASAEAPELKITSPPSGTVTNNPTPTFEGTTSNPFDPGSFTHVGLDIHRGPSASGELVRAKLQAEQGLLDTAWSVTVTPGLPQGTYTAVAKQTETIKGEAGESSPVTFTVDTEPPLVTITYPAGGSASSGESQLLTGSAGGAPGDIQSVTIQLFAGSVPAQPPVATQFVTASGGRWSAVFGLQPGTYTAQAIQGDEAGNTGTSAPVTFTLTAPPPGRLPVASFSWFPPAPVVGQSVVLVSSSTDSASPLTGFAWDLAGSGPFRAAGPVLATSFATAGRHVVRLQVLDARGASSVATERIPVGLPPLRTMQPFPIVRIAGVETAGGVKLSLLSVQAPVGTRVTVTCRGRGCRTRPQSRVATASKHARHASSVVLAFRRFERSFPAGATLEVRVSAAGELGKYTLFAIHRHSLPTRVDSCLSALDPQPVACST